MNGVAIECRPVPEGWTCSVEVAEGGSSSHHAVHVRAADLARLDPTAADPTDLVRRSFDFLLRRESKESILSSFELTVISRYFPDFETEIRRRV